jgi:hypothetical protein
MAIFAGFREPDVEGSLSLTLDLQFIILDTWQVKPLMDTCFVVIDTLKGVWEQGVDNISTWKGGSDRRLKKNEH